MEREVARSSEPLDLVDRAEELRRQGRIQEALVTVGGFLQGRPSHPRALLLRSRLLYKLGRGGEALAGIRDLSGMIEDRGLQSIASALEQLEARRKLPTAPAFATESMAKLLVQQGYFLEAMEIYRRLFEATSDRSGLWDEMARLRGSLEREGSRGASKERVLRELEACERWFKDHRKGP